VPKLEDIVGEDICAHRSCPHRERYLLAALRAAALAKDTTDTALKGAASGEEREDEPPKLSVCISCKVFIDYM